MKILEFILLFLIFNISQQAQTETNDPLTYNYNVTDHVLTVELGDGTTCPFLYILIDETTKPIRVSKDNEPFWNDIRVQRDNSYEHIYEIGIKTDDVKQLKFNLSKEYSFSKEGKDKEDEEYLLTLTAAQVESWESFKKMHCNETNYWEYE